LPQPSFVMKDIVNLNLNLILALEALLAEMNVTRAAERLNVTQPAMSRSLQKLREHLGDELLVRSGRGMVRTARAERIYASLRHGLQALRRALNEETEFVPEQSSRIFRIAARDVMGVWLLPKLMAHVRQHAPGVSIHVVFAETSLPTQLDSGALDLTIGVGFPDAPGLKRRTLFRDGWVCLARKDHEAVASAQLNLDQYVALPHALCSPTGEGMGVVDEALAKLGHSRRIAYRTLYFIGAAIAVAQTDMILTMPRRPAEHLAIMLNLTMSEPPIELPPLEIVAVWHERMDDDPAHRWLRQTIVSMC
jgi:DNA-binding transcriptional LysR family regulator